ncbi:MAG: PAS domain S-box protein [Acidobacteria bacterium]|nr:PAS domain S-box protein [Acidobacteriota bacterium]
MSPIAGTERDETISALRDKVEDYERWLRSLDAQIRVLERERQKLSAVLNHSDAAFIVVNSRLQVTWANHVFATLFGAGAHQAAVAGRTCHELVCRRDAACAMCPALQPFNTGCVAHHEIQTEINGEARHIYATAMPILSPEGRIDETIVMLQDISDLAILRRSEEALRTSEERFRSIFENAGAGMATISPDGWFLQVNRGLCDFLGYEPHELWKLKVEHVTHREDLAEARRAFDDTKNAGVRELALETRYVRKDGAVVWGRATATWVYGPDAQAIYAVAMVEDVTQRKTAEEALRRSEEALRHSEEQLRQAQKMDAIGTLAGGIAHDFNNILTGVIGYAELLKLDAQPGTKVHNAADVIHKAARRGADLTQQLLGFARKGKQRDVTIDVRATIREVVDLLGRTIDKKIVITQKHHGAESCVVGDPSQIQQIILNLAVNARDAMPDGGELTFTTAPVHVTEREARVRAGGAQGAFLSISVGDTGSGIEADLRQRIFEPFFTTKERGKGTGMGLAMVYGIVKNHGGSIHVESEVGRGTCFSIYLPLASPRHAVPEAAPGEAPPVRGSGLVLVVDDEEPVRSVATAYLKHLGYEVLTAANGEEAVDVFQERGGAIDLVLMDLVMPKMGGPECFRILKGMDSSVRVVLSTGYGFSVAAQQMIDEGMVGLVQKPYEMRKLSEIVARALKR